MKNFIALEKQVKKLTMDLLKKNKCKKDVIIYQNQRV